MNGHGNNNRGVGSASVNNTQSAMANMTLQQNNSVGQHSHQSIPTNRMPPPPPMPAIPSQQQYQQQSLAPPQPVRQAPSAMPGRPLMMHHNNNNNNNNNSHAPTSRSMVPPPNSTLPPPPPSAMHQQQQNYNASSQLQQNQHQTIPSSGMQQQQSQTYNNLQSSNTRAIPQPPSTYHQNVAANAHNSNLQQKQFAGAAQPAQSMPPPPPPSQMMNQQQANYHQPTPPLQQSYPTQQQQQSYPQPPQQQQYNNQPPSAPPSQQPKQPLPNYNAAYQQSQNQSQNQKQQYEKTRKINPEQIPRLPLPTRPFHSPATICYSSSTSSINSNTNKVVSASNNQLPPAADSRYIFNSLPTTSSNTSSSGKEVNPRLMRCTTHTFPVDNATYRKVGALPLGLVITPLASLTSLCGNENGSERIGQQQQGIGGSSSQWNGREQGDIYNSKDPRDKPMIQDYIPPTSDGTKDPERIPVIHRQRPYSAARSQSSPDYHETRTDYGVNPPRCNKCYAYLNQYCTPSTPSTSLGNMTRGIYSPTTYYNCNFCGASKSIELNEEDVISGRYDNVTRVGTVEYEVGGEYCVREHGEVENVHLYGVEYTSSDSKGGSSSSGNDCGQNHHHHHHGQLKSHGWQETLNAIKHVAKGLAQTAPPGNNGVRIGIFAFHEDKLIFPYWKKKGHQDDNNNEQVYQEEEEDAELAVAIVSDVTEDPFSPLPLHVWTYNVGNGVQSKEYQNFIQLLESFTDIMDQLLKEEPQFDAKGGVGEQRNCGGAALSVLSNALHNSGGRATLITTRRPNYGVGALRDRETKEVVTRGGREAPKKESPYRRSQDEERLFTPLQHISSRSRSKSININEVELKMDEKASLFYKTLGDVCAKQRICIDIVVTSSLVKVESLVPNSASNMGARAVHPNPREFLDVATLSELCRVTCGKFKWLRVGNECGVVVGDDDENNNKDEGGSITFTGEQLREELKRSALAYMGSDAVFKLRCSNGVQVKSYSPTLPVGTLIGDGIVNSAELELSSINSSTCIAVTLEHKVGGVQDTRGGRRGVDSPMVFFQSAVLYTTMTGKRRVRVSTMGLLTTKVPADVFRASDLGACATLMLRQAISDLEDPSQGSLHNARTKVYENMVSLLANYRMNTSARTSPTGQLILPESLQLLPLFCLSLGKSRLLRSSSVQFKAPFPTADERAYHIFYGRIVSPNTSLQCVHPNLLKVSDMRTRDGEWITPPVLETNKYAGEEVIAASMRPVCQLPRSMNPSIACLDEKGMYILDDRFAFYLFIGKDVPEKEWQDLLSVSSPSGANRVDGQWINNVPMGPMALSSTDSGNKLRNILHQLRILNSPNTTLAMNARNTYAPLILVFVGRGSVFEEEMDSLLVDDATTGHDATYVDFLCELHQSVRKKIDELRRSKVIA